MLKEQRRLVIVPRETPMSLPQLRNMVLCAEAGAMILPAMPAFYQLPKTLDDLADFMAGKILTALGFEQQLFPAVDGRVRDASPTSRQAARAHRGDVRRDRARATTRSITCSAPGSIAAGGGARSARWS